MQVIILCGGQGTRIRDVADDIPRPMVPIGGRPILWHIMKLCGHHSLSNFVLCLGYKSWVIKRYFLEYHLAHSDFSVRLSAPAAVQVHGSAPVEDWKVTLVETGLDAMTGCRIKRVERYIRGSTFLLTYGDGLADVDLRKLLAFHHSHGRIGTVTAVRPPGRFGEIALDGQQVLDFSEKPQMSQGWISGGFFVFGRRMLQRLTDDPALIFERQPLTQLARDGELMAYRHDGFWQPMDTARDHRLLNDLWAAGAAPWKVWQDQDAGPPACCGPASWARPTCWRRWRSAAITPSSTPAAGQSTAPAPRRWARMRRCGRSHYAVAKAAGPLLCQAEARRGRPVVVVRIFGAYGPGEAPHRLVPHVMACCLHGQAAHLSLGLQRRDWVFLDDVIALLQVAAHAPNLAGQVLHAATGCEHSVREVVEMIREVSGRAVQVVHGAAPARPDEPDRYLADIRRTQALTGWRPGFDLRAGIARTWEWFLSLHAGLRPPSARAPAQ